MKNETCDLNLEALFSQLTEITQATPVNENTYLYLLLLWAYFEVSVFETENDVSRIRTKTLIKPEIIQVDHAYPIFDYGSCLKTSAGKYYGSVTTGRLLITVREMIKLMSERGVNQLRCEGLISAKRFAWLECEKYKIKIENFIPDKQTLTLRNHLHLDRFHPHF